MVCKYFFLFHVVYLFCWLFPLLCKSSSAWWNPICLFLFLLPMIFGVISKKIIVETNSRSFSPMFSSNNFRVSGVFKSLIHFELVFYMVWDKGLVLFFHMWLSSFLNSVYWRDYSFPVYILRTLPTINCLKMRRFISRISIVFHWSIYLFLMLLPCCFDSL